MRVDDFTLTVLIRNAPSMEVLAKETNLCTKVRRYRKGMLLVFSKAKLCLSFVELVSAAKFYKVTAERVFQYRERQLQYVGNCYDLY